MKFNLQTESLAPSGKIRVGQVFPVRGGRGLKYGHLMVLVAVTEPKDFNGRSALMMVIDRDGMPVGVSSYGLHYVEDLNPVGFVDGLEDLQFDVRQA